MRALRGRRGVWSVIMALLLMVLLGFGSLAVDVSTLRLAVSEAQDVADAASQAALITYRKTLSASQALSVARVVANRNTILGQPAQLTDVSLGMWSNNTFITSSSPNAARATVGRTGEQAVPMMLGGAFGWDNVNVQRVATTSTQTVQIVMVIDITNSWSPTNFANARAAILAFLDTIGPSLGSADSLALVVFNGRYSREITPMTSISSPVVLSNVRAQWAALNKASKAGTPPTYPSDCSVYTGAMADNFTSPLNGCFPDMPREYADEGGTDHTVGLQQAIQIFEENPDVAAFRAMVVLTDGMPTDLAANHGTTRRTTGYVETRWREYQGVIPHTKAQIKLESNTLTQKAWDEEGVHTWVISFVKDDVFMHTMPKGLGYYSLTSQSSELVTIFSGVARSMPLRLVH